MVGTPLEERTSELLSASNVTPLDLLELRAGRLPERLGDRRRAFGRATRTLGLAATAFALLGAVAGHFAEEPLLSVGMAVLVLVGLALAVHGARVAGDRAFHALDTVVVKRAVGAPPQRTLELAGRTLRVDDINLRAELWDMLREGEPVRAYLTKRGGVLLALEPR